MITQVVLLRGINVGGKNILPMQDLRALLTKLGCESVSTYIQSGNVVLRSDQPSSSLARSISKTIEQRFGFKPLVLVMSGEKLNTLADANPYADVATDPKFLHTWFLAEKPTAPDVARIRDRQYLSEQFTLTDDAFYLHAPEGIGRSKLANEVEKCLGVPATARNWRTVRKLMEMVAEAS